MLTESIENLFIVRFIKREFPAGKAVKIKGYAFGWEIAYKGDTVQLGIIKLNDKKGATLLNITLVMARAEIQMYFAPAPKNTDQAETLFSLMELQ